MRNFRERVKCILYPHCFAPLMDSVNTIASRYNTEACSYDADSATLMLGQKMSSRHRCVYRPVGNSANSALAESPGGFEPVRCAAGEVFPCWFAHLTVASRLCRNSAKINKCHECILT